MILHLNLVLLYLSGIHRTQSEGQYRYNTSTLVTPPCSDEVFAAVQ